MAKLKLKQKEWLTLREAAEFVSHIAEGPSVKPSDIIQYAIEDELILSLRTVVEASDSVYSATLIAAEELSESEREAYEDRNRKAYREEQMVMFTLIDGKVFFGDDLEFHRLMPSIYDINTAGLPNDFLTRTWDRVRRNQLEDESLLEPDEPNLVELEDRTVKFGPFIELLGAKRSIVTSLPTYLIPPGSLLMVRSDRLHGLFEDEPSTALKADLTTKEKKTFLRVIRALCEDHKDIDLAKHSTAASQIIAIADSFGLSIPGQRTLEVLLKEARDLED